MRKYYGVAGTRGYGVYTNWNQAKSARRHTPQYKVKGEKDFDKAKAYAKDKFDELQNGRKDRFYIEDITSVNVFYNQDSSIHKVRGRSGENISYGNTQNQNECQGDSYQ